MKKVLFMLTFLVTGLNIHAQVNPRKFRRVDTAPTRMITDSRVNLKKDTLLPIAISHKKLNSLLQNNINLSAKASAFLENYTNTEDDIAPAKVVSVRILRNSWVETVFSDGSKEIQTGSGYMKISAAGDTLRYLMAQVQSFVPPSMPTDPNINTYLQNVSITMLNLLKELLNNDQNSITNYLAGEANLNLYEIINRRFKFINYVINNK